MVDGEFVDKAVLALASASGGPSNPTAALDDGVLVLRPESRQSWARRIVDDAVALEERRSIRLLEIERAARLAQRGAPTAPVSRDPWEDFVEQSRVTQQARGLNGAGIERPHAEHEKHPEPAVKPKGCEPPPASGSAAGSDSPVAQYTDEQQRLARGVLDTRGATSWTILDVACAAIAKAAPRFVRIKLPPRMPVAAQRNGSEDAEDWGYNEALDDCASALREAGIDVE